MHETSQYHVQVSAQGNLREPSGQRQCQMLVTQCVGK